MSVLAFRHRMAALAAALLLAACGSGSSDNERSGVALTSTVSFGDSLSDVGTYRVGTIAAIGGGKWTVNSADSPNWTELVASAAGTPAPCPAQTGLLPNIPGIVGAPVMNIPACRDYAEGSARVSQRLAPNAAALQSPPFNEVNLGLMAVPVAAQMDTHLAVVGGAYAGTELVTVMAGANDLFMNFNGVAKASGGGTAAAGAALAAGWSSAVRALVVLGGSTATDAATAAAYDSMRSAGSELADLVRSRVLAKGARHVIVINMPDISQTPFGLSLDPGSRSVVSNMVTFFNSQLQSGLNGSGVLLVDLYAQGRLQAASPAAFGIGNATTPACDPASPNNPLQGSSLGCTAASTVAGDTRGFLYADSVHPTPLGYRLIAQHVIDRMREVGWL